MSYTKTHKATPRGVTRSDYTNVSYLRGEFSNLLISSNILWYCIKNNLDYTFSDIRKNRIPVESDEVFESSDT